MIGAGDGRDAVLPRGASLERSSSTTGERVPGDDLWVPPLPSRATLQAPRAAKGAGRSTMVGPDGRQRDCHSLTEARVFAGLLARPDVRDLREQPAEVSFVDEQGRRGRHTFDAIVDFDDGYRLAVLVKPEVRRERTNRLGATIAAQLSADVADGVLVMTEKDVPPDQWHDAKLLNSARLHPRPDHDEAMRSHLEQRSGEATVADLCRGSGLDGDAFRAVARLVADGTLRKKTPGRITPDTVVTRAIPDTEPRS